VGHKNISIIDDGDMNAFRDSICNAFDAQRRVE
jgi:hypothetical protein